MTGHIYEPLKAGDPMLDIRCTVCEKRFEVGDRPQAIGETTSRTTRYAHAGCVAKEADAFVKRIKGQRTEILEAFVAKYGCQPDEAMQVQIANRWMVVKIDPEERKAVEQMVIGAEVQEKFVSDVETIIKWIDEKELPVLVTDELRQAYIRLKELLKVKPAPIPKTNIIVPRNGFNA